MPPKAIAALTLFLGLSAGTATLAQPPGPLASEQSPVLAEPPYAAHAAQAARLADNETSGKSDVPASEQGLENLDSERARARQVGDRAVPQAMQTPQPLASDSPAAEPGQ